MPSRSTDGPPNRRSLTFPERACDPSPLSSPLQTPLASPALSFSPSLAYAFPSFLPFRRPKSHHIWLLIHIVCVADYSFPPSLSLSLHLCVCVCTSSAVLPPATATGPRRLHTGCTHCLCSCCLGGLPPPFPPSLSNGEPLRVRSPPRTSPKRVRVRGEGGECYGGCP